MQAIKKQNQKLQFKINGEVFHGVVGDQEDPNNIRKCSQCQKNFILGTGLCPSLSCTGPITKAVRDDMILREAHRVWDMFQNNHYLEDWQLKGYLEITRDHPMNIARGYTDEISATNVAQFIQEKVEICNKKLHDGWVRPQFEVVKMKTIFEKKKAAGKSIHGIRGRFSMENGKKRQIWNRARDRLKPDNSGYYDGVLDRYDHDLGIVLNGKLVPYRDTVQHMTR